MDVELPDGSILQGVPEGTGKLDLIKKLKANDNPNWTKMAEGYTGQFDVTKKSNPVTSALGEAGLQAASGLYHTAKAGYKGLADIAQGKDPRADIAAEEAKTYQPKTEAGKIGSKVLNAPVAFQGKVANKAGDVGQRVATSLGASPQVAAGVGTTLSAGIQAAGPAALFRRGAPGKAVAKSEFPDALSAAKESRAKDPEISRELSVLARSRGYKLKPSEAGGIVGKAAEGLAGSPKLSNEMSIKNQKVTNRLIAEEHRLPEGTRVTRANLAIAKKPHSAVYREASGLGEITTSPEYKSAVKSVGPPPLDPSKHIEEPELARLKNNYAVDKLDSKAAVLHVRQLRSDSVKNIKAQDPQKNALGYAQRQVADAIDSELERKATEVGKPDLVKRLRTARKELAKIHTTEAALVGNSGDVSAQKLAQMQERGVPLDGNQKIVADIANEFGEVMRTGTKVKNKTPFSVLEGTVGIVGSAAHHPGLAAGIIARPATRQFLMSDLYQNRIAPGPRKPNTVSDLEQ